MAETQLNDMDSKPRVALINKPKLDVSVALVIREEKDIKKHSKLGIVVQTCIPST